MGDALTIGCSEAPAKERNPHSLYVPSLQDPLRSRYPNISGILGRIWTATVRSVISGGFFWFGLFEFAFAVILGWLCYRYCIAELMSGP